MFSHSARSEQSEDSAFVDLLVGLTVSVDDWVTLNTLDSIVTFRPQKRFNDLSTVLCDWLVGLRNSNNKDALSDRCRKLLFQIVFKLLWAKHMRVALTHSNLPPFTREQDGDQNPGSSQAVPRAVSPCQFHTANNRNVPAFFSPHLMLG